MSEHTSYDLESTKLPYLSGFGLRMFVALLEGPLGKLLLPDLFDSAGVTAFRNKVIDEDPTLQPLYYTGQFATSASALPVEQLPAPPEQPGPGLP